MIDIHPYHYDNQLFDNRYRFEKPLGEDDPIKDVWLAIDYNTIPRKGAGEGVIDESSGLQVVIKIYQTEHELDAWGEQHFQEVFKTLQGCQHTNLLQPIGFSVFKGSPYLVLPYCEAGSAKKFKEEKMTRATLWKFISDVASGLDKQHSNKPQIVHQAIKPSHILIDDHGNFVVTNYGKSIIDLGSDVENGRSHAYMAPERFEPNAIPSPESDIWAFGATLCEILIGGVPFGEEGGKAQIDGSKSMPNLKGIPSSVRNLIKACLDKDPKNRPTAHQIMDWVQAKNKPFYRKPGFVAATVMSLILIGGWTSYYFNHHIGSQNPQIVTPVPPEIPTIERAKELLKCNQCDSITVGIKMLDSLIKKRDYQAALLKSRLYFTPDPLRLDKFYEEWEVYRSHCQDDDSVKECPAKTDQNFDTAHRLLYLAKELSKPNYDYKVLYYLGCDYKKGYGCEKNLGWARWCFEKACFILVEIQNSDTIDVNKVEIKEYLEDIRNERLGNLTDVVANEPIE